MDFNSSNWIIDTIIDLDGVNRLDPKARYNLDGSLQDRVSHRIPIAIALWETIHIISSLSVPKHKIHWMDFEQFNRYNNWYLDGTT